MKEDKFEELVIKHSYSDDRYYNSVALSGEVGEVCNCVKKIRMALENPDWVDNKGVLSVSDQTLNLKVELSDTLFYLTKLSQCFGSSLEDLMNIQSEKLKALSKKYGRVFKK